MNHEVAQIDDSSGIVYGYAFVQIQQMVHGFSYDFQLTLYGTTELLIAFIFKEIPLLAKYS